MFNRIQHKSRGAERDQPGLARDRPLRESDVRPWSKGIGEKRRARPLHKRCVGRMIEYLLAEGTVSTGAACDDCHDWAYRVYSTWLDENPP